MKIYSVIRKVDNEPFKIKHYSTKRRAIMGFYAELGEIIFVNASFSQDDAIDYIKDIIYINVIDGVPYYYSSNDELSIEEIDVDEEFDVEEK